MLLALLPLLIRQPAPTRVSFTENYRYESLFQGDSSSSQSETAWHSRYSIRGELDLKPGMTTGVADAFSITVGKARIAAPLGDLAARGRSHYDLLSGKAGDPSRTTLGTVDLTLKGSRLGFRVESKGLESSPVASEYNGADTGSVEGFTTVRVGTAGIEETLSVPYRAKIKARRVSGGNAVGSVVVVEVKGG